MLELKVLHLANLFRLDIHLKRCPPFTADGAIGTCPGVVGYDDALPIAQNLGLKVEIITSFKFITLKACYGHGIARFHGYSD